MSLRHLWKDINGLGVYPDIVHGHLTLSGTQDVRVKGTIYKNKYYGCKIVRTIDIDNNDMVYTKYNPTSSILIMLRMNLKYISCIKRDNRIYLRKTGKTLIVEVNDKVTRLHVGINMIMIRRKYFTHNNDITFPEDIVDKLIIDGRGIII